MFHVSAPPNNNHEQLPHPIIFMLWLLTCTWPHLDWGHWKGIPKGKIDISCAWDMPSDKWLNEIILYNFPSRLSSSMNKGWSLVGKGVLLTRPIWRVSLRIHSKGQSLCQIYHFEKQMVINDNASNGQCPKHNFPFWCVFIRIWYCRWADQLPSTIWTYV